ncbi:MAG: Do family serine endopeptidase [Rhodospirillaceae bacterium]|nr:MAG: Do family serine endopeptidase [Rhodospirillaceae bacterium]
MVIIAVVGLALEPAFAAHAPSDGFADLAERLLPSVVNISSSQIIDPKKGDEEMDDDTPLEEWFRDYFENHRHGDDEDAHPHKRRQTSLGSGFIIDKAGYIVTNNHVIENADKISVILQDDTVLAAQVVGRDPKVDVALLKVNAKRDLKPLVWGNSDAARVGEWVLAIGNPFGLGGSVSAGIISARARDINAGQYDDFLQTDAAINRGNSGGPLLNQNGEVIGINTAIYSVTGGSAGVGFAAPSNLVRPVLDDLRKFGRTRRGWLGVKIQTVTPEIAESLGLDRSRGALVSAVDDDGPAAKSAVQVGDVIMSFDGKAVGKMRELPRLVANTPVDRTVDVEVWRQGKQVPVKLKIGELKEEPAANAPDAADDTQTPIVRTELKELGVGVAEISDHARDKYDIPENIHGLVVLDVDEDMDAAQEGLHRGDVIDEIQQAAVATPADAQAALQAAQKAGRKTILLRVVSGDNVHFLGVKLH